MCLGNWDSGRDKTFGLYTVIARTQISENSSSRKIERFDQEFSCRLDRVILPSNLPNRIFDQKLNWLKLLIGKLTTKHDVPQCRMANRHGENPGFFHIGFFQTFFGKSIRIWLDTLATHQTPMPQFVDNNGSPHWIFPCMTCKLMLNRQAKHLTRDIQKTRPSIDAPKPQFTLTFGNNGQSWRGKRAILWHCSMEWLTRFHTSAAREVTFQTCQWQPELNWTCNVNSSP